MKRLEQINVINKRKEKIIKIFGLYDDGSVNLLCKKKILREVKEFIRQKKFYGEVVYRYF